MLLKALTFDIIGTVFDAYGGLSEGVGQLNAKFGIGVDATQFAADSLKGCDDAIGRVLAGEAWMTPDTVLMNTTRMLLPLKLLGARLPRAVQEYFGLWRRLPPWPDVQPGLQALYKHYTLAMLSDMSGATQAALRSHAGLPFDRTLSAEMVKTYKPSPAVYRMAVSSLGFSPDQILMVSARDDDLNAARDQGLRTALIARPSKEGAPDSPRNDPAPSFDFTATGVLDLAQQLGAAFVTTPDDCMIFKPQAVQIAAAGDLWIIADGSRELFRLGTARADAERACDVIRHYGLDRICFIARPHPAMTYFTTRGRAPSGPMAGEDAVAFDPAGVVARQIGGNWIVGDGVRRLLDFGSAKVDALHAVTVIKHYGFTHQCFVGPLDAPMMYFRT